MRLGSASVGQRIADSAAAAALFAPGLAGLAHEALHVAYLAPDRVLIGVSHHAGSLDRVELPLRPLVAQALTLDAAGMILAHNHPGGSPQPSRADIAATRRLAEVAHSLDIDLIDHLIFAGEEMVSFRAMGLL